MGVLADLLANASSIDISVPHEAGERVTVRKIKDFIARIGDPDYPSGLSEADEVQGIAVYSGTVNGGTFTLTFTLQNGVTFTTAAIAHSANAATIQSAIDTAAAPKVTGWTNGDIAVTGGPLTTTPVVLTFSGASVDAQNHGLTTGDGALLTGGGTLGAITETTAGQVLRTAIGALVVMGILSPVSLPAQGVNTGFTIQNTRGKFPHGLDEDTVKDIIHEAAVAESNAGLEPALLTALGY